MRFISIGLRELWNNIVGISEREMCHRYEYIKQTVFAEIVEKLKGENVNW